MRGTKTERPAGSGVWRLRVYIGTDPATGHPRQVSRTFKGTVRQADTALAAFVTEVAQGQHGGPATSFGHLLDEWFTHITAMGSKAPSTLEAYGRHLENRIKPALGKVPLRKLTAHHLDRFYADQLAAGLSAGTVANLHAVISGACSQGVRWGWLPVSPARSTSPPPVRRAAGYAPTRDEARALIQSLYAANAQMGAALFLAAATGARRGELCGLRWGDVDWEEGRLRIERSIVPLKGGHVVGMPKTHKRRTITLGTAGIDFLAHHRTRCAADAAEMGTTAPADGWVLSEDGGHSFIKPSRVSNYVAIHAARLGMPQVHLHSLRHYTASQLMGSGFDPVAVAAYHGHVDPHETLNTYAHALPGRDRAIGEFLSGALDGVLPPTPGRETAPQPEPGG